METQSPTIHIKALYEQVKEYTETAIQLAKLKTLEKIAGVITAMVFRLSVILLMALFVIIFTFGIALYLGEVLGKIYYGFFIVAGFYLLLSLTLHFLLKKRVCKPISSFIIKEVLQ